MKKLGVYFFIFTALLLSSCSRQKYSHSSITSVDAPSLFIHMPENKLVFRNLSPMVFQTIWNHFDRVGFTMVTKNKDCFSLNVTIQELTSTHKFLSADVLTYGVRMKITLLCQLFDFHGTLAAQKTFSFSTFISKSKDHVLNDVFLEHEYEKLLQRRVPQIDHYFRPYLIKKA